LAFQYFSVPFRLENDRELMLKESDIVIADLTAAGLDVGFEIGYAALIKKPLFCVYNKKISTEPVSSIIGMCLFLCDSPHF
jgi:nucleoside 2-deoxyribosyltransferase